MHGIGFFPPFFKGSDLHEKGELMDDRQKKSACTERKIECLKHFYMN